jgi:hypothetical protein
VYEDLVHVWTGRSTIVESGFIDQLESLPVRLT